MPHKSVTMTRADNGYVVESYDERTMRSRKLVAEDEAGAMRHLRRAMAMRKRRSDGKYVRSMPHMDMED